MDGSLYYVHLLYLGPTPSFGFELQSLSCFFFFFFFSEYFRCMLGLWVRKIPFALGMGVN